MDYTFAIIVWTICAVAAWAIARSKGAANPGTWAFLGLVLGPIGVLWAIASAKPPAGAPAPAQALAVPAGGFCPKCGTQRAGAFRYCQTCGLDFEPAPVAAESATTGWASPTQTVAPPQPSMVAAPAATPASRRPIGFIIVGIILLIAVIGVAISWANNRTNQILADVLPTYVPMTFAPITVAPFTAAPTQAIGSGGPITFGSSLDETTLLIPKPKTEFKRTTDNIAWSAAFSEPAGATTVTVIFARVGESGSETLLYTNDVAISNPDFDLLANEADLAAVADNKAGTYVLRYVRDSTVLAEGTFELTK